MTKNPFTNALIAIAYIAVIASFLYYGQLFLGPVRGIIVPVVMLSIFVLSAAFMGLVFFYQPVQMYLDGDKKGSLSLFTKTMMIFAGVTILLVIILFLLAPRL
ncbi:MAG: hypothetical protein ABSF56_01460 [Minisyncoccia bacterium]|jgi:hypothetical protein